MVEYQAETRLLTRPAEDFLGHCVGINGLGHDEPEGATIEVDHLRQVANDELHEAIPDGWREGLFGGF